MLWGISLMGCITPYEPTGIENIAGDLVVEGMIIESGDSFVKLSRTNGIEAESGEPYKKINDAKINLLSTNGNVLPFSLTEEDGVYKPNDIVHYDMGASYAVEIQIGNDHYQSEYQFPLKTPEIEDVSYKTSKDGTQVDIRVSTSDPDGEVLFYRWNCEEDWEYSANYKVYEYWDPDKGDFANITNADDFNIYYCWNHSIPTTFALGTAQDRMSASFVDHTILEIPYDYRGTRFSVLYSVLVKQYGIDKKAYTYYSQLKKNIEEMGSIFAPQPTELKGNIQSLTNPAEKVIGYVMVTSETSKRFYIDAAEVPSMAPISYCGEEHNYRDVEAQRAYDSGLGVLSQVEPGVHAWVLRRCVDCRGNGGTKNKPEWWPNDHK